MKTLLKNAREQKGLTTRQVSEMLNIDQALISKFENGFRRPTENQVNALSLLFEIDREILITAWLKEKILEIVQKQEFGLQAIKAAEKEMDPAATAAVPDQFQKLLAEMESLKTMLSKDK